MVTFVGDQHDGRATGPHLLHVRQHLGVQPPPGGDADDDAPRLDQRDRSVFHLARRIGLGPHVRNLLKLQRPFERGRVAGVAAEEKEVPGLGETIGQRRDVVGVRQRCFDLFRQRFKDLQQRLDLTRVLGIANLGEIERQQLHRHNLSEVRLRGRHSNLWTSVGVEHSVGFARH